MYIITLYTLNYYQGKYFISLFAYELTVKYVITAHIPTINMEKI